MSDSITKTELIEENRNLHIGKKVLTAAFIVISVLWVFPVLVVVLNAFKINTFVKTNTFAVPFGEMSAGFKNCTFLYVCSLQFHNNYSFNSIHSPLYIYDCMVCGKS